MSDTNNSRTPAPFSFAASQYFEGPDGQWSSFVVCAGTPEQSFRVLPSTVTSETFVPLSGACKPGSVANCAFSRGAEIYQGKSNDGFQANQSSTWHQIGIYQVAAREELGYNASGLYGLDSLGLEIANSGGPVLQNQVIAGVVNPRFWARRLGMDVKPRNFSEFENSQRSLIKTLKEENYIPSLSYGYTAGAYYKKPSAYGSLVYGGYDQSRFVPNDITFPFDANDSRKPSVNIQSIVSRDLTNTTASLLLDGAAYSLIDFGEPQMWLPVSACDAFAKAFNLTYDNSTDLYLVDLSTRSRLLELNPSIIFGLGTTADPGQRVNVVLPYNAFNQQATYPIYPNATNYFPIRRAYNDTQYTIGRMFFQEAYVRVDYDRGNFSVHQAASNDEQDIVPIISPKSSVGPAKSIINSTVRLNKGDIAGISIGAVSAMAMLFFLAFWLCRRKTVAKHNKMAAVQDRERKIEVADQPMLETDGSEFYEKDSRTFAEMECHEVHELNMTERGLQEMPAGVPEIDLSSIVELYEMEDTEFCLEEKHDVTGSLRNRPTAGWI